MTTSANKGKYDAKISAAAGLSPIIQHNIGHWGISNVRVYAVQANGQRFDVAFTNLKLLDRDRLQLTVGANTGNLVVVVSA